MNQIKRIILTLLVLIAVKGMNAQSFQPYKSCIIAYSGYDYPVVPGTESWKNITYAQRLASLQMPDDTLQNISTSRLLETCLYYPFNINIFALDDKMAGYERVKESFNGYDELVQRTDFVQELMNLYNSRDVAFVNRIDTVYDRGLYSFDFQIMEFMFTDAANIATNMQAAQIAFMLMNKMDQKEQHSSISF